MPKLIYFILALALIYGCGPKVDLPEGAPKYYKTAELIKRAKEGSVNFKTMAIKGKGRYEENGKGQGFRFEIRLAKDSLIWLDIADPFLGLKVVRGLIDQQNTTYYNRLERNYQQGSSEALAQQIGFSFDFEPMMGILSASFLSWDQNWYQDYQVGHYQLVNYPLEADQNPPPPSSPLISQNLAPESFRPIAYRFRRPQAGQDMRIELLRYEDFEGLSFPSQINLDFRENNKVIKVDLDIKEVQIDKKLSFPFRIPPGYEKL